ncbi:MAG: NAD(P)/FAD-dependent oxidoreductase, partial [Clostridia bacterium]
LTPEQLENRLLREFAAMPRKQWIHVLPALLPARMADVMPALCDIVPEKPVHQISREERKRIVTVLKNVPLPIASFRPLDEAIITRGGVEVKEILPAHMASRRMEGLFFAGEVLDVDAHTGGFNLQIAFSTGVAAGRAIAIFLQKSAENDP